MALTTTKKKRKKRELEHIRQLKLYPYPPILRGSTSRVESNY